MSIRITVDGKECEVTLGELGEIELRQLREKFETFGDAPHFDVTIDTRKYRFIPLINGKDLDYHAQEVGKESAQQEDFEFIASHIGDLPEPKKPRGYKLMFLALRKNFPPDECEQAGFEAKPTSGCPIIWVSPAGRDATDAVSYQYCGVPGTFWVKRIQ